MSILKIKNIISILLVILVISSILAFDIVNINKNITIESQQHSSFIDLYNKDLIKRASKLYVLKNNIDLKGGIFDLPEGITLDIANRIISNGCLCLDDNDTIINGLFIKDSFLSYQKANVGGEKLDWIIFLSAIDKSNILIKDCSFICDIDQYKRQCHGVMAFGTNKIGCKNIIVDNCDFRGASCDYYSNVSDSKIRRSVFAESTHMISVETTYFKEHQKKYPCPKNINISNCSFFAENSNSSEPPIWCSGIQGLLFSNDYFETDCTMLQLYCGDGNIALDSVVIDSCQFVIKTKNASKKNVAAISCRGKSYSFYKKEVSFGDIRIINSIFKSKTKKNLISELQSYRAINSGFVNKISIENCEFDYFRHAIGVYDQFRTQTDCTTTAVITSNKFEGVPIIYRKKEHKGVSRSRNDSIQLKQLFFCNNELIFPQSNKFILDIKNYKNCNVKNNSIRKSSKYSRNSYE